MDARLSASVSPPLSLAPQLPTPSSTTMPLPPEATYSSKEELYRAIQAFAIQHHYAFTIGRSNKTITRKTVRKTVIDIYNYP
ncbi:hypothetical protein NA56DRAFT_701770 [Hyaloscypha hepaticicola]|uniref:Uncharacterized protein n=1 Tax=Hyaloscypha hepaticicola TaxID=2082293 RepID=A0A2J6QB18_9HELO|nr:hypothetical protein NA56DRAFT_701770 [Hyaloscypha hepaticicola]